MGGSSPFSAMDILRRSSTESSGVGAPSSRVERCSGIEYFQLSSFKFYMRRILLYCVKFSLSRGFIRRQMANKIVVITYCGSRRKHSAFRKTLP